MKNQNQLQPKRRRRRKKKEENYSAEMTRHAKQKPMRSQQRLNKIDDETREGRRTSTSKKKTSTNTHKRSKHGS